MSDSKDNNNGLGLLTFIGLLGLIELYQENERCEHGNKKRDCPICRQEEIARGNMIFTTGLAYALFTNFFLMLFYIILYIIGSSIIFFIAYIVYGIFISDPTYARTFGLIVGFGIFIFWTIRRISKVSQEIRDRNNIYFTSTDNRQYRLPASLSVKFWAGKTYVGSYPQIYYLKKPQK